MAVEAAVVALAGAAVVVAVNVVAHATINAVALA